MCIKTTNNKVLVNTSISDALKVTPNNNKQASNSIIPSNPTINTNDKSKTNTVKVADFTPNQGVSFDKASSTKEPSIFTVNKIDNNLLKLMVEGKVKIPFCVDVKGVKINVTEDMVKNIKNVEFTKGGKEKLTDVLDLGDGALTKGYGCTNQSLFPYIKDEKSATQILLYQTAEHIKTRFEYIPEVFLKNLNQNQVNALASAAFNLSPKGFAGRAFEPVKIMNEAVKKPDFRESQVQDTIQTSMTSFVAGVRPGFSGILSRRVSDYLISVVGQHDIHPYDKKALANKLIELKNEASSDITKGIKIVINKLKNLGWSSFF
ncbi:MAG: hypothetical protein U0457_12195 [Candidatus Sericytochromatia bacterium]